MDRSIRYAQVMSNFGSAYNASPNTTYSRVPFTPFSSSASFPTYSNPSPSSSFRPPSPTYNLDLYRPDGYYADSMDYPSPASSVIIHHHPVCPSSPMPPSSSFSHTVSKLRQVNDELCHTLASCEPEIQYQPPPPVTYQIHHHPISQRSYADSRSRSTSEHDSSSSVEPEPVQRKNNARIKYKMRVPRRQKQNSLSKLDQILISTSDAYSHDDPLTIDVYPTRDQGFTRHIRDRPDNQKPWLESPLPTRRNSFADVDTHRESRTPRGLYSNDKPVRPNSRLANARGESSIIEHTRENSQHTLLSDRPPSSPLRRSLQIKPRIRRDSAPNPLRHSTVSFASTAPVWRPNGSLKPPKFIGSNAPPTKPPPAPREDRWNPAGVAKTTKSFRAFDPRSISVRKPVEPVWRPSSMKVSEKVPKYFEPSVKPELVEALRAESEVMRPQKIVKSRARIPGGDPQLRARIAQAESKVKSAWRDTGTGANPPVARERKPPMARPIQKSTVTLPPKSKTAPVPSRPAAPIKKVLPRPAATAPVDTGRSSLNDIPTKPLFQSTPMNQSVVDEHEGDDVSDMFATESQLSERLKRRVVPDVRKFARDLLPSSVKLLRLAKPPQPKIDHQTQSTIKDGVLIHGNDADAEKPSTFNSFKNGCLK